MLRSIIFVCLSIILFSGCAKTEPSSKKNAVFRMNIYREPLTMDPRKSSERVSSAMAYILFEGLMRLYPDGTISCAQAKSVEISDDRLTYTFHMRDTVWSDGTPVTAHDFEYSWKKILSPDFPSANANLFYPIKNAELAKQGFVSLDDVGIHSVDDKTLVIHLESPTPYFLDLITFCVFFPVNKAIDLLNPNWCGDSSPQFISNGPFTLKSWKHNNEVLFQKNPGYWESDRIFLEEIHASIIPDENTALQMFEHKALDVIGLGLSPIPTDAIAKYQQKGLLRAFNSPGTVSIVFNVNKFPFNNKNIRKSFGYAINRAEIVNNIAQLGESIATNIVPPLIKDYVPKSFFKDNNVELARLLFKQGCEELGISEKDFPEIMYDYIASESEQKIAQAIQQQWAQALGVKVNLRSCESKVFLDKLGFRDYEMAQSLWVAQYDDLMNIFERFKFKRNVKNSPGWENPEFIRLLEKTAYDSKEERVATFAKAEELLIDEMPLAPVFHRKISYMINPRFTNAECLPNGAFDYTRLGLDEKS